MIDDDDLGAVKQGRHLVRRDIGVRVMRTDGSPALLLPLENIRQRSVGVDKKLRALKSP